MDTSNQVIDKVMKKLHEMYFLDSFLSKSRRKVKVGHGADNGKDPMSHEEKGGKQEPEPEEYLKEDRVVNVEAPRQKCQKITVTDVVDLTEPTTKTKSTRKKKRKLEITYYSKLIESTGKSPRAVVLNRRQMKGKLSKIDMFLDPLRR